MNVTIVHVEKPEQKDVLAIAAPLQQFNLDSGPPPNPSAVVFQLLDPDGNIVGGLFGKIGYEWLFIEFLVVPTEMRGSGLGRDLMNRAEALARESGCIGAWLQTLSFQARPFYEKLGFQLFATLDDFPSRGSLFFMKKKLAPKV